MSYSTVGPADGRPLLFIGGMGSHRLSTHPFEALAYEHGVLIINPDRPGTGLTTPFKSTVPAERIEYARQLIVALLEHVLGERDEPMRGLSIAGQSCGTSYALDIAAALGDKVESLSLVSPWVPLGSPGTSSERSVLHDCLSL